MPRQRDQFLNGEGDAWFQRNTTSQSAPAPASDPILAALESVAAQPASILEIGCATGYRLEALRRAKGCHANGIDPSRDAISCGRGLFPELDLRVGCADALDFADGAFDLVIFGFCLYLCDRQDLFRIAAEADRVLADHGLIAIYDFYSDLPHRNAYIHRPGLFSYKMDYARLFDWNPAYTRIFHRLADHDGGARIGHPTSVIGVTVLLKDVEHAFPKAPDWSK